MSAADFLDICANLTLGVLTLAFFITIIRIVRGPTTPDRVLALDMLVSIGIGYVAVIAIKTGFTLYLDIAIALGLVGFLGTVAFARFVLTRGRSEDSETRRQPPEASK